MQVGGWGCELINIFLLFNSVSKLKEGKEKNVSHLTWLRTVWFIWLGRTNIFFWVVFYNKCFRVFVEEIKYCNFTSETIIFKLSKNWITIFHHYPTKYLYFLSLTFNISLFNGKTANHFKVVVRIKCMRWSWFFWRS